MFQIHDLASHAVPLWLQACQGDAAPLQALTLTDISTWALSSESEEEPGEAGHNAEPDARKDGRPGDDWA